MLVFGGAGVVPKAGIEASVREEHLAVDGLPREGRMIRADTGIENRDRLPLTRVSVRPKCRRPQLGHAGGKQGLVPFDGRDLRDPGVCREQAQRVDRDGGAEHVDALVAVDIAAAHSGDCRLNRGLFRSDGLLDFLERGLPGLDLHLVRGLASLPERFRVWENLACNRLVSALDDFPPELARSLGPFEDRLLRLVLQDDEHRSGAAGGHILPHQHNGDRR